MATQTPNMPYRPKSPEHFKSLTTRSREKEELRDLNERLLVYVNHMRSLKEIEETEEHIQVFLQSQGDVESGIPSSDCSL